jgi:hypothetical protein
MTEDPLNTRDFKCPAGVSFTRRASLEQAGNKPRLLQRNTTECLQSVIVLGKRQVSREPKGLYLVSAEQKMSWESIDLVQSERF